MALRAVMIAGTLVLATTTAAMAQSDVPGPGVQDGVVAQVDTAAGVVTLQDGRMYRVEHGTELVAKGNPASLASLQPGDYVTITRGRAVILRDGQYVPAP